MRILLATPSLLREVGGPAYSVSAIAEFLQKAGIETINITRRGAGGRSMKLFGDRLIADADLVHNFGTWSPFNHRVSVQARRCGVPQVFCPMGMLEPWALAQKRLKKRAGWFAYQRGDIARSAAVHATADAEAQNLRAFGVRVPIAVIPHGIHAPHRLPDRIADGALAERTALFLSRIHPKKGLLDLVAAWARLRPRGWKIVIAGPDEDGYRATVEDAVKAHGLESDFVFAGAVYGEHKAALLARADLMVLPTYSENFGVVVVEALSYGVPVLTTTGAPWRELVQCGCGWWTEPGVSPLANALSEAFSLPRQALLDMGLRGRALVEARYAWPAIIEMHKQLYQWILGGGHAPAFVLA